jgi:PhoH-like ATPase
MNIGAAQNFTPLEVKTIVARAGTGTKIVFTGDPCQLASLYVDGSTCGSKDSTRRRSH